MNRIVDKNPPSIDTGRLARQIAIRRAIRAFQLDRGVRERQMRLVGFGPHGMVRFGSSPSEHDKPPVGFEELAMPLFDSLYNFARWLVHNQNNAEDLVQETYLKALRSFASFQPGTNFRAWIFRILKNTFLNSCSRLEQRMTVAMGSEEDEPELAVESETPETILIERSNRQIVQSAIDELPAHYREALLLCEVEEMSYQEIPEILSIPIGTVMSRLARARRGVRESLGSSPVHRYREACLITEAREEGSRSV